MLSEVLSAALVLSLSMDIVSSAFVSSIDFPFPFGGAELLVALRPRPGFPLETGVVALFFGDNFMLAAFACNRPERREPVTVILTQSSLNLLK